MDLSTDLVLILLWIEPQVNQAPKPETTVKSPLGLHISKEISKSIAGKQIEYEEFIIFNGLHAHKC